jgi:aromatic ring-opening dioxygenase LigB subunit
VIIRAAVVPHPPLLVPELVGGATEPTEAVRAASVTAARRLADVAGEWVAVAADPAGPTVVDSGVRGSFAGYGVDVPIALGSTPNSVPPDPALPLPALVAGWLRSAVGARSVRVHLVEPGRSPADCRRTGAELAETLSSPTPVGLLILGDGSNRHTERAPARPDERAGDFDDRVRTALATPDPAALLDVDPDLAAELGAAGRAAWQVLAGVALAVGGPWTSELLYSDQPFGVAYHVAVWDPPAIG